MIMFPFKKGEHEFQKINIGIFLVLKQKLYFKHQKIMETPQN